jgi:hypothetical protein
LHSEDFACCARAAQAQPGNQAGVEIADHGIVTVAIATGGSVTAA